MGDGGWFGAPAEDGDLRVSREIARQRAGRKRDDETDAEYAARVREFQPRGEGAFRPTSRAEKQGRIRRADR